MKRIQFVNDLKRENIYKLETHQYIRQKENNFLGK